VEFVCSRPIIAVVLEAVGVAVKVRSMIGPIWPQEAAPGTIRGDFAHQRYTPNAAFPNLVHASATVEEAHAEIDLWFAPGDLLAHRLAADSFTMLPPVLPTQTPGSQG
jgi:nucleoside-diphosphate kinase